MLTLGDMLGDNEAPDAAVEVVTATAEQLNNGISTGAAHSFPDLAAALSYAKSLPTEQQECSWIRSPTGTKTIAAAEAELTARRGAVTG